MSDDSIVICSASPVATFFAVFLAKAAILRSSERTPDSLVYSVSLFLIQHWVF